MRESESWASVIAVWSPTNGRAELFLCHAVPFGAVGSVIGFNRAARAVWAAVSYTLRVVITNFYDDYPSAELSKNAAGADTSIRAMFALLGWELSLSPSKNKPYNAKFDMLGVCMDLSGLPEDKLVVSNKPDRITAISAQLDEVIRSNKCSSVLAGEIRGKCQFASNQIYGRVAMGPLRSVARHQYHCKSGVISEEVRSALVELHLILTASLPRTLSFKGEQRPVVIYTDGACEGEDRDEVSMGAVAVDTVSGDAFMFGVSVDRKLVLDWKRDGRVQTIGQAELLPVLMARLTFKSLICHRRTFYYIDNDSARMSLIKGGSPSASSNRLILSFSRLELESQSWSWFARVPSASNPADGPSRLRLQPHPENLMSKAVNMSEIPRDVYFYFD